jgi:hypothetical protein
MPYSEGMQTEKWVSVAIVAPAGVMSNSLKFFLSTLNQVNAELAHLESITDFPTIIHSPPEIWIVDMDILKNPLNAQPQLKDFIELLRSKSNACKVILIVNSMDQKRDLQALGADRVLLKRNMEEPLASICAQIHQQLLSTNGLSYLPGDLDRKIA